MNEAHWRPPIIRRSAAEFWAAVPQHALAPPIPDDAPAFLTGPMTVGQLKAELRRRANATPPEGRP